MKGRKSYTKNSVATLWNTFFPFLFFPIQQSRMGLIDILTDKDGSTAHLVLKTGGNFVLNSEQQQLLPYYHEHARSVAVMINQENMLHFFLLKKKSLFVSLSSGFWFLWPTTFWNTCTAFICIFIKYRKANPHSEHSPFSALNGKHSTNKHHWMTLKTLSLDIWKHQICLNELRLHKHWWQHHYKISFCRPSLWVTHCCGTKKHIWNNLSTWSTQHSFCPKIYPKNTLSYSPCGYFL